MSVSSYESVVAPQVDASDGVLSRGQNALIILQHQLQGLVTGLVCLCVLGGEVPGLHLSITVPVGRHS